MSTEPESVLVCGGGLVGSLLAVSLARRGLRVELLERRPDPRLAVKAEGRSINLAVSVRGFHALAEVGLEDEVRKLALPMRGRTMHALDGSLTFQRYGQDDSQCIHSVSRAGLNRLLLDAAEGTGRVKIRFGVKVVDANPAERWVAIQGTESASSTAVEKVGYVRCIGTDGSGSALRASLAKSVPDFRSTEDLLSHGYKELTLPAAATGAPGGPHRMDPRSLHIWPRGSLMLIALPNLDGSFTCTLFLPWKGQDSFGGLTDAGSIRAFFRERFPDALALLDADGGDFTREFQSNPTGQMVTVKCAPWHHGESLLLLGDAAHAIVPFFGQGMNCGFEDVTRLGELLDSQGWDGVFQLVARDRKPNADAIADLAVENFVEMRDRVGDPRFLLQKEVEARLAREFPGRYVPRYTLVTFSREPYRKALETGLVQKGMLEELCAGLHRAEEVDLRLAEKLIEERLLKGRG